MDQGAVEIIKAAINRLLSWPVAVFAVGFLFKRALRDLLNRVLRFGFKKGELSFEAGPALQQEEAKPSEKGLEVTESPQTAVDMWESSNPLVRQREQLIREDISKAKLDGEKTIDVLINRMAVTQLYLAAERTYRVIFGSQIFILKQLNTSGPASSAQLMAVYNNAKARWPEVYANYSFDRYINFLISQGLIASVSDYYAITDAGREFLKWMVTAGVSEQKQL